MRILQIHLSIDQGGAYSAVKNLSCGFNQIGHRSIEIFNNSKEELLKFNYDFVLMHSFQGRYTQEYLDNLLFLEKYKIPYIVLLHDYWPICPQNNLIRYKDGLKECSQECDPVLCGFKEIELSYNNISKNIDYVDKNKVLDILNIIKQSKTVCFNEYSVNIFEEHGFENIKMIHHGIDLDLFKPMDRNKDFTVLFTNAWGEKELKGFKHWEWLKKYSSFTFKELLGNKSLEYMPSFYNSGNCLLFLSLWPETFGLVILEALACNIPVISYPVGVASEIIKNGENGYLVNSFNINEVRDRIEEVSQKEYYCRNSVLDFSIDKICQKYIDFLGE